MKPHVESAWRIENRWQLEIASEAWALFPERVPYLGGIHMVPKAREIAGYLTSELRTAKRARDRAFVNTLIRKEKPRYFIHEYMTMDLYLRPAERKLLHSMYVPYRHNLYVHAGRAAWDADFPGGIKEIELLFEGSYTVRLRPHREDRDAAIQVDGDLLAAPGSARHDKQRARHQKRLRELDHAGRSQGMIGVPSPAPN